MSDQTPATRLGLIISGLRRWPSFIWCLEARLKGVQFEGRALFVGRPIISVAKGARMVIGNGVMVSSSVRANLLACPQPSVLRAMVPGSQLILAQRVGLSAAVICAGSSIEIGEGTILGSGAMVIDNDFHVPSGILDWADGCGKTAKPIKIGGGVFIGARAIVLKGVTIGDRAVVGAGAVVTKPVPPRHIAVGNPARIFPIRSDLFEKSSSC